MKSLSGRAAAMGTSESPFPDPISTIRGARLPKTASQSTWASSAMDVSISAAGTSMRKWSR